MKTIFRVMTLCWIATLGIHAQAQGPRAWDGGGGANNNWTTVANWVGDTYPSGLFDETAVIDNGATVLINSNLAATIPAPDSPPGGLNVSNGSKLRIEGVGAFSTDITGGTVTGAASFSGEGTLILRGNASAFTSQNLSFAGGGIYNPELTSANHGLISVPSDLNLGGGVLKPTLGFSPAGAQSWVLADATAINGTATLDTSGAALTAGQKFFSSVTSGGVNGRLWRLDLKSVLVATVNADTGATSISSPTGVTIPMAGYGLTSVSGQLNPAGWTTITSQVGAGWNVAGTATANHLDEVGGPIPPGNTSEATLNVNATPRTLGSPFNANLPFGTAPDLKLEYVTSAGEVVVGDVLYTGGNAVNNLLLTVDPVTGQGRLTNSSKTPIRLSGYSILSAGGSLKPTTGWNSLHDQGLPGVDEANASATNLSELVPQSANNVALAAGQSYNLGAMFTTTSPKDLSLEFFYTAPLVGDYNGDNAVNAADYTVIRDGLGSLYTAADLTLWRNNFGATGGSATPTIRTGVVKYQTLSAVVAVGAVPEPASIQVAIVAILLVSGVFGQQWRGRSAPHSFTL